MSSLAVKNIIADQMTSLPPLFGKGPFHGSAIETLEQDRLRISQELHDDLGQRLALLEIQLTQLEDNCSCPETTRGLNSMRERVREMDRDVHRICCQLYPVLLEKFGLAVALKSLCRDFSQLGIDAEFVEENCPKTIGQSVSLCLYRVVQEALHNVSKHAKTKHAKVSLRGSSSRIEVIIRDEGVGFDRVVMKSTQGLGLASIEERVRRSGGRSSIHSIPEIGTEVKAVFYTFILVE
jgi:signal transduction histidine kinase